MIRLAHALIARSQRRDPRLHRTGTSSRNLPARLIDVGLDNAQPPRLVDSAGQTGYYVALSHCWGSRRPSETQLTGSNVSRLPRSIEPSEIPRCAFDAMNLTRSLGMRYIWIDSLCVVPSDQEGLSNLSDIYRSAVITILPTGTMSTNDENIDSCIDSSVLEQPFSIFLDWSRPIVAKSFSERLFAPNSIRLLRSIQNASPSTLWPEVKAAYDNAGAIQINECGTPREAIPGSDRLHGAESVQLEVETPEARFDEASREIVQGVHHVEASKIFEALAFFMKARELVSTFQTLTLKSWRLHTLASANIALVYQMQHLPAMALDIAEASLAVHSSLPQGEGNSTFE